MTRIRIAPGLEAGILFRRQIAGAATQKPVLGGGVDVVDIGVVVAWRDHLSLRVRSLEPHPIDE